MRIYLINAIRQLLLFIVKEIIALIVLIIAKNKPAYDAEPNEVVTAFLNEVKI
jgi:hypothetical protein